MHYYEDGNVRMSTSKDVDVSNASGADAVVREIAKAENKFQEELNRAFVQLSEGSFKGLRRQLPVTRQRVEWEKIGGYRVSLDISQHAYAESTDMIFSLDKTLVVAGRSRTVIHVDSEAVDAKQGEHFGMAGEGSRYHVHLVTTTSKVFKTSLRSPPSPFPASPTCRQCSRRAQWVVKMELDSVLTFL